MKPSPRPQPQTVHHLSDHPDFRPMNRSASDHEISATQIRLHQEGSRTILYRSAKSTSPSCLT